ncbi:PTS transporter subunit EIIA [Streptomyces sp. HNM0574]|nr:fructose-specific PTS transporter subunit EIIC [Streptomyces sp. HNM0574]NLU70773.1 PTS transporter subunit EIIA [Streptomyces sp. HNM0574]
MRLLAVTACPTGIAHTYMAAEKLTQAAEARGVSMKVETQGSIGSENVLTDNDINEADGVIIAADKDVDRERFAGKRLLVVGVAEGISDPDGLIDRVGDAPVHGGAATAGSGSGVRDSGGAETAAPGKKPRGRGTTYKALMNGVSYMIPFVVVGGLLIAISLALGGSPQADGGLVIPDGSFWKHVNDIGTIGFTLMVPILSGYIAYAIGDRPALVPGMIGGWIANTGELYDSESGAGFIGAIVTGFLAGYLVQWIKKVRVPKFAQPIMPIIVIPILASSALGLFFIYVIGRPISWVFEHLTSWLGGMTGTGAALLGIILGLMITFDMGGPVNKTAFLFGAGLVSKNPEVMGMCAAAIPVPPLGQGIATLLRRRYFTAQERETGYAALFMGFFGITEGAIPFAAARPARVIPANMLGGAAAGAVAGLASVAGNVPHGGPIVALLGAVDGVAMFFVAIAVGTAVTALATAALLSVGRNEAAREAEADVPEAAVLAGAVAVPVGAGGSTAAPEAAVAAPEKAPGQAPEQTPEVLSGYLTRGSVREWLGSDEKEAAVREMAGLLAGTGKVADVDELVRVALAREEQGTTGLGDEIAVPHAKTDAVTAPVVGFARSAEGIEWGAPDGTKARLVFMISVPEAAAGDEHLRVLARLSRKLIDADYRQRLLAAEGEDALLEILAEIR